MIYDFAIMSAAAIGSRHNHTFARQLGLSAMWIQHFSQGIFYLILTKCSPFMKLYEWILQNGMSLIHVP